MSPAPSTLCPGRSRSRLSRFSLALAAASLGLACTPEPSAPTLVALAVTPAEASVTLGAAQSFTATGTFSSGTTRDVTAEATWSTSAPAVASVSNEDGARGRATGRSAGVATVTATLLGASASATLTVTARPARRLVFRAQPGGGEAGAPWSQQPVVAIEDEAGATVNTATTGVTLTLVGGAGAALSGAASVAAVAGVATFSGLAIARAATGYTLVASAAGLESATSAAFDVTAAAASRLVFTQQPGGGVAGATWSQQPVVAVQDAFGNTVTSSSAAVALALSGASGGGALAGATTVAAVNGVATFAGLSIERAATGYALVASTSGLASDTSAPFDVGAAAASRLAFTTEPGGGVAGAAWAQQPVVAIHDAFGNTVTTAAGSVTLALAANPGGGALSGSATAAAVNGVATFTGLSLERAAAGYTLSASSAGLAGATSAAFAVTAGPASRVAFSTQPGGGSAGAAWSQQPIVTVEDALGNRITASTASVTLALAANPGGGALSGTATVAAVNGVATFTGLSIDRAAAGYALSASSSGLASETSAAFTITPGAASRLAFTTQPGGGAAGAAWSQQPVVVVQDALGNTVTASTASVTLTLAANPGGGALSGTATVAAANGVATFAGLSMSRAAQGSTLAASSAGLTGATSVAFDVTPAAADRLAFVTQPGGGTAGAAWGQQPVVAVQDAFGNTVTTSSASVTLALATNPAGGALSGTATIAAVNGLATFSSLSIERAAPGYTLSASSSGLASGTSAAFTITVGAASRLGFTTQPGGGTAGLAWLQQPAVAVQDAFGNTIPTSTASVTLALGANPGGGALSGARTVSAVNGVATFGGLSIERAAAGYTLTASASGLASGASAAFTVTPGAPAQLQFAVEPGGGSAGTAWAQQPVVVVQDSLGNTVTTSAASVTLALAAHPGGGTLSGGATVSAVNGVASFTGLSIERAAAGYALGAAATGLAGATSASFNVTPAAASRLAFTTQPGGGTAGAAWAQQPVVTVQDAFGNTVTTSTVGVTLALGANPAGGALAGTSTLSAVGGVVSFSGLSMLRAGAGYTLTATRSGLTSATSAPFAILVGPASKLVFTSQPGGGPQGAAWSQQPAVAIQDAAGNTVPTASASVTLALAANPSAGALSGTLSASAVSGVASFSGLSINKSGVGYTLSASSPGLPVVTSQWFSVTPGAPSRLVFSTQPGGGTAGAAWTQQPVVTIQDAAGNVVDVSASVTVAIAANPGTGVLAGTTTLTASSGSAYFSGLSINALGSGYTLSASTGLPGVTGATSAAFTIGTGAGVPASLSFTQQPGNGVAGGALATSPRVAVVDTFGNVVASFTGSISLYSEASLAGSTSVAAVNGIATYGTLTASRAGTFTLSAYGTWCPGGSSPCVSLNGQSAAFTVTTGAASKLALVQTPLGGQVGAPWCRQPAVEVQDAQGNVVPTDTRAVTVALAANPGGGALDGTTTVNAVAGRASFSGLSLNAAGAGYTLAFSAPGLASVTSGRFEVFTTLPASTFLRHEESYVTGLAVDSAGALYAVGETSGAPLLGTADLFVQKYATPGALTWERRDGAADAYSTNVAVALDSAGNVTSLGYTDGLLGAQRACADYVLTRHTPSGTRSWLVQHGTTTCNLWPVSLAVDRSDNVYVLGATGGTLDGVVGPSASSNYFLTKYAPSGLRLWTVLDGVANSPSGSVNPVGVRVDAAGNVYVAGDVRNGTNSAPAYANFDGLARIGTADAFLSKYDADGVRQWTRLDGVATRSISTTALAVDAAGNAVVSGRTSFSLNGQPRVSTNTQDLFVLKYDPSGARLWTVQRGATGVYAETYGGLVVDASSNVYLGGFVQVTAGTTTGLDGNVQSSSSDVFLMKLDANGVWQWTRQRGSGGALGYAYVSSVAIDSASNLYLAGAVTNGFDGRCAGASSGSLASLYLSFTSNGVVR
jgi:hypothetical protein